MRIVMTRPVVARFTLLPRIFTEVAILPGTGTGFVLPNVFFNQIRTAV